MTKQELKKIIATVIATSAIVTGANMGIDKARCDYVVFHQEEEICVTAELHDAIKSQLQPNSGFGGINFGGE